MPNSFCPRGLRRKKSIQTGSFVGMRVLTLSLVSTQLTSLHSTMQTKGLTRARTNTYARANTHTHFTRPHTPHRPPEGKPWRASNQTQTHTHTRERARARAHTHTHTRPHARTFCAGFAAMVATEDALRTALLRRIATHAPESREEVGGIWDRT